MFRLLFLITIALLIPLFFLLLFLSSIYNKLVMLRNRCQDAYSQMDAQLKGGDDLIPQDKAASTCRAYNDAVTSYNAFREALPNKLIARIFHFETVVLSPGAKVQNPDPKLTADNMGD